MDVAFEALAAARPAATIASSVETVLLAPQRRVRLVAVVVAVSLFSAGDGIGAAVVLGFVLRPNTEITVENTL